MNVEITLTAHGAAAMARIAAFPARLLPAVARGVDTGLELALGQVTARRFTGKGPFPVSEKRLGVVTGRLRQSLRRSPARVDGDAVRAAVGSNVKYFGIHEFGFNGTVNVKSHSRVRVWKETASQAQNREYQEAQIAQRLAVEKGISINAAQNRLRKSRGKRGPEVYEQTVKAHSRRVNLPAREPMRTGITEQAPAIGRAISAALGAEWNGGAA